MIYLILGKGFEELEAVAVADVLRRGGVELKTAGIGGTSIAGSHGISVEADAALESVESADMVILPGGMGGVESIMSSEAAMKLIGETYAAGGRVAAICAAPMVLGRLGILSGKKATIYPGMENEIPEAQVQARARTVEDGRVLTGQGPGSAIDFALALLGWIKDEKTAKAVRMQLHY